MTRFRSWLALAIDLIAMPFMVTGIAICWLAETVRGDDPMQWPYDESSFQ